MPHRRAGSHLIFVLYIELLFKCIHHDIHGQVRLLLDIVVDAFYFGQIPALGLIGGDDHQILALCTLTKEQTQVGSENQHIFATNFFEAAFSFLACSSSSSILRISGLRRLS